MPRTKGRKKRPKTNTTKDYASQIAEKQEIIASLNTGEYSRSDPMKYRFMLFCCFAMCWEYGSATCLMLLRPQRFLNHEYST